METRPAGRTQGILNVLGVLILVLSVIHVRAATKQFHFRHNRFSPFMISRYQSKEIKDLSKHEYETVESDHKPSSSRFKKLDRLLNSLHHPKSEKSHRVTPKQDQDVWDNVLGVDVDDEFTQGDDIHANDSVLEATLKSAVTPTAEIQDWENNIGEESDYQLGILGPDGGTKPVTTTPSTLVEPLPNNGQPQHSTISSMVPHYHHQHLQVSHLHPLAPKQSAKKRIYSNEAIGLTEEHRLRVKLEGQCRLPRAKVIHVVDAHPYTHGMYIPHCTVLHRCGRDTGCCDNELHVCRNKTSHLVHLPFRTNVYGSVKVVYLPFYNDTECECGSVVSQSSRQEREQPLVTTSSPLCICPRKYSVRRLPDGTCMCDCFHQQRECLKLKKGNANFSTEDQLCIKNSTCLPPTCQFGQYLPKNARCVKENEIFRHWPSKPIRDQFS